MLSSPDGHRCPVEKHQVQGQKEQALSATEDLVKALFKKTIRPFIDKSSLVVQTKRQNPAPTVRWFYVNNGNEVSTNYAFPDSALNAQH
jgi:hypothetical protein